MEIIDFHVHPFRRRENCLNIYPEMENLDANAMRSQLMNVGITGICGSVLSKAPLAPGFDDLRRLNREALALAEELGGYYTPGFHIHPAWARESCEEVEFMHRRGVRLIGELVPYMHGWGQFDAKNWHQILDVAGDYSMLCCYHTPFDFDMTAMLEAHPNVTFIAAHPGDREAQERHIHAMKRHDNLHLDLSGTGLFRFGMLRHLVNSVGDERILFGTDYPICNPRMYVQAVLGEPISDEAKEKILHSNANRLFNACSGRRAAANSCSAGL